MSEESYTHYDWLTTASEEHSVDPEVYEEPEIHEQTSMDVINEVLISTIPPDVEPKQLLEIITRIYVLTQMMLEASDHNALTLYTLVSRLNGKTYREIRDAANEESHESHRQRMTDLKTRFPELYELTMHAKHRHFRFME